MIDAICITGGEPTIQSGLIAFLRQLKEMGFFVKLDTNGIRPSVVAESIQQSLVDYIAMDIKAPWEKYRDIAGDTARELAASCRESLRIIQDSSVEHEFRTTVFPSVHNENDFFTMAGYLKPGEQYYIQKTQFTRVLDPSIHREMEYDIQEIVSNLATRYSSLRIAAR